jgi:hypothetical protein
MASNSRIRFNPVTKEIEIEGAEAFVKKYFGKLQAMISGTAEEKAVTKKEPKAVKAVPVKADKKKLETKAVKTAPKKKDPKAAKVTPKKTTKIVTKRKPGEKRVTNQAAVVTLIQGAPEGISTAELKEKTGLAESQIWNIINSAAKAGKLRKMKRGLYGPVAASQE